MPADILITAPLPPFLYDPLKAAYRCHDYHQADDKQALLAARVPPSADWCRAEAR